MKWLPFLAKAMGKSVWLPAEGAGRAILLTSDVVGPMAGSYAPWYEQSMNPRPWRDSPKSQQVSGQIGQGDVDLPARENKALLDYHTRLGGEHGVRYRRFRLWTLNSLRKSLMPERRKRKWSAEVTTHSDALDLEPEVFKKDDPADIAASLKQSAEVSGRRKSSPYRSAMSMLTFYLNRAGRNLSPRRKRTLEAAKGRLRELFGRKA